MEGMVECYGCGMLVGNRYGPFTRCPACERKRSERKAAKARRKRLRKKLGMNNRQLKIHLAGGRA